MKRLIINADDFGYSFSVNKGIIEAHTNGVVTSTSVMVDAIAAQEAAMLSQFPDLSVGLHFMLDKVENVQSELERQVQEFVAITGVPPTHIDTHKRHTTDDGIKDILANYSKEHSVPIRQHGFAKFIETFIGFQTNNDVSVGQFKQAIDMAKNDVNEIMCHVGYVDDYLRENSSYSDIRADELKTICDPAIKKYIAAKDLRLCNWTQIS
jgi:predicted glycoside hydrolase/deacetylase ChbG (UPF0249 family)